jgi:UDP-N-acetylglucosamine 2-epimerase (non-hydrolysing)
VGYLDSVALQAGARMVLTDSGGMQEETTVLGVPCVTLRTTTERPITITDGTNQLVGTDPTGHPARRAPDALLAHVARDVPHH